MVVSIVSLALSWAVLGAPATVGVQVFARAAVDAPDLVRARETFQMLLTQAGVSGDWQDCTPLGGCGGEPRAPALFVVQLLPMRKADRGEVCAELVTDGGRGSPAVLVYVPAVADRVHEIRFSALGRSNPSAFGFERGHLIGLTIAHEIGHALGLRHAARGVMKARLDVEDMVALQESRLAFSTEEATRMREWCRRKSSRFRADHREEPEFRASALEAGHAAKKALRLRVRDSMLFSWRRRVHSLTWPMTTCSSSCGKTSTGPVADGWTPWR